MAQSTWSADSNAWSGTPHTWGNDTYAATATIAANNTFVSVQNAVYPVAVTMTQVILSQLNGEDTVFPRSLSMGTNFGMTGTGLLAMPVTATITGLTGDIKNNVNFPETATLSMNNSASSVNSFLWNDIEEDEDTLWTKISDPDN
jgi:hypothetical protein